MTTFRRLQERAGIAYRAMQRAERDDGSSFIRAADDAPEWVRTIIREAHGDLLPDDWRYATIREAFGAIHDAADARDLDDPHDFADSTTDVYSSDLLAWVGSSLLRAGYVDDARAELGEPRDFFHGLQMGQYLERAEVYAAVLAGLRDVETEQDEEEDA